MKKFASILMGNYDIDRHKALFRSDRMETHIRTVRNMDQAKELLLSLKNQGFGVIEFCGAFTDENLEELREIADGELGLARVVARDDEKARIDNFFKK